MSSFEERVRNALARVIDPELDKPITELGMVGEIKGSEQNGTVEIKLTVSYCPYQDQLKAEVEQALNQEFSEGRVSVSLTAMTKAELDDLKLKLRGPKKTNPFGPGTSTRVILVSSGKGGVGKSTIAASLATGLANSGKQVGLLDADIFGFSIMQQMGIEQRPTRLDDMMLPPVAHGVKVISIGMFLDGNEPVSWRGPMLHKAIEQFLTDVYWGSLDFLIVDLPPGTGDVAISLGQLLPNAKVLVVTTADTDSAKVAVRSALASAKAGQEIIGVIENLSWIESATGEKTALLGSGGGQKVAEEIESITGKPAPLLVQIPLSLRAAEYQGSGTPLIMQSIEEPTLKALNALVEQVAEIKLDQSARTLNVKLSE